MSNLDGTPSLNFSPGRVRPKSAVAAAAAAAHTVKMPIYTTKPIIVFLLEWDLHNGGGGGGTPVCISSTDTAGSCVRTCVRRCRPRFSGLRRNWIIIHRQ